MSNPASRRGFLAGLSAISASGTAGVALPALAASPAGPHPDQAVFDAEAEMLRAEAAYHEAKGAHSAAFKAAWDEIGVCPAAILVSSIEASQIGRLDGPRVVFNARLFQTVKAHEDDTHHDGKAWIPDGLRLVIQYAVAIFGQGGTTPMRIRRYRALLPIAEAFEARRTAVETRHTLDDLWTARRDAGRAMSTARDAMDALRATTPAGLAVLVRHVGSYGTRKADKGWIGLLQSAAAVAGIEVHEPSEPRVRTQFM